eukprot:3141532-Amphidinium_carterae.1
MPRHWGNAKMNFSQASHVLSLMRVCLRAFGACSKNNRKYRVTTESSLAGCETKSSSLQHPPQSAKLIVASEQTDQINVH